MKKMKKAFSARQLIWSITCVASLLLFGILAVISNRIIVGQETQQMAKRWSQKDDVAQVSCFFSVNTGITQDSLEEFEHSVDSALEEASIVSESPNANARLWADAYSADGQISISSELSQITVDAIGIGGDFFLFHPLKLVSGSYFSGNDLMQDYCILDEDAAWKLFGSNNITGQVVYIGGVAHIVAGVVEKETGGLYEEAGLSSSLVYVSYQTLAAYGRNNGINHYEIVMPNPVDSFAKNYVAEHIGVAESEMEIIENSSRYSFFNRVKQMGKFFTRAMNGKAIIYPYWENVARAYEDILAFIMFFEIILLGFPVIVGVITLICLWRHRTWTVKGALVKAKDILTDKVARSRRERKQKRKLDNMDE